MKLILQDAIKTFEIVTLMVMKMMMINDYGAASKQPTYLDKRICFLNRQAHHKIREGLIVESTKKHKTTSIL